VFRTIRLETDSRGVARLTLSRPEKHNALDAVMIAEITEAARMLASDPAARVAVLASEGRSFCAGGDLGWMRAQMEADAEAREAQARALAGMLAALDGLPMPLLAAVQGPAYGGGVGLLAVCDMAVGVEGAVFAMTETRLGIIPATIGPYVLARIGAPAARRLMLPARRFGATEAVGLGLLSRISLPEELSAAVEEEVAALLACAPGAVADTKRLIRDLSGRVSPEAVDLSIRALVERWESQEAQDGITAFFDKTTPPWILS
jgi:methylglutaconyl-CoA hydratase